MVKLETMELSREVVETLRKLGVGHRGFDDPFFDEKAPPRLGIYDVDEENLCHQPVDMACPVPGCRFTAQTVLEHSGHYNSAHRYSCAICRRLLPSPHLLDLHLQETHDSFFAVMAEKTPSYCCYVEECKEKFRNAEERFEHCVKVHKLPKDFRLEQATTKKSQKKSKSKKKTEKMEISDGNGNTEESSNTDRDEQNASGVNDTTATADTSTRPTSGIMAPKNFTFGHCKNKSFPKPTIRKFTGNENKEKQDIDMDVIVMDLKESLPE